MAFGIKNTYLSEKKYHFTISKDVKPIRPAPSVLSEQVKAGKKEQVRIETRKQSITIDSPIPAYTYTKAVVVQGGGRDSYLLPGYTLIFRRNASNEYVANVPEKYIKAFAPGTKFSIGCGCGGRKKTILQIV